MTMSSIMYVYPMAGVYRTKPRQRDDIKTLASSHGELAVRHVNVLLRFIEEEYAAWLKDVKELFPKSETFLLDRLRFG